MNSKVIIVWSFAIIALALIGAFGYFNQNLLLVKEEEFVPVETTSTRKVCQATTVSGRSVYTFTIDAEQQINNILLSYTSSAEDLTGYEAANLLASEITSQKINGLTSSGLQGGVANFDLKVGFNPREYDKIRVEELTNEFSKLYMVLDSIQDYEIYKQALANLGVSYQCE